MKLRKKALALKAPGRILQWMLMGVALTACAATYVVLAEEHFLALSIMSPKYQPLEKVRIGLQGLGGSPEFSDQNGKVRLHLPPATEPNSWVTLQLPPQPVDLVFVSPWDARVRVPPWEEGAENYDPIYLARRADRSILESGPGITAVHARINQAAAKKRVRPQASQQNHGDESAANHSASWATIGVALPRKLNVNYDLVTRRAEERVDAEAIEEASKIFGFSPKEITAALDDWGGRPLTWKLVVLTGSLETGKELFSAVIGNYDGTGIGFGVVGWNLKMCTLQPLLTKFREKDPKRFDELMAGDAEWIANELAAPCPQSFDTFSKKMLDGSGALHDFWKERFKSLGREPIFQRVQVQELAPFVERAQAMAQEFNLHSERASALFYDIIIQSGTGSLHRVQDAYGQNVAKLKSVIGREPDELERLLIVANTTVQRTHPRFQKYVQARRLMIASGAGTVTGRYYDLEDYGIGLRDVKTGQEMHVHADESILSKLKSGWLPAGGNN